MRNLKKEKKIMIKWAIFLYVLHFFKTFVIKNESFSSLLSRDLHIVPSNISSIHWSMWPWGCVRVVHILCDLKSQLGMTSNMTSMFDHWMIDLAGSSWRHAIVSKLRGGALIKIFFMNRSFARKTWMQSAFSFDLH